jgi:hypothetical protein
VDTTCVPATEASAVASAKTGVAAAEAAAMSAATMTSAVLRPQGHAQQKRERRDSYQAAHYRNYTPDDRRDFVKVCI